MIYVRGAGGWCGAGLRVGTGGAGGAGGAGADIVGAGGGAARGANKKHTYNHLNIDYTRSLVMTSLNTRYSLREEIDILSNRGRPVKGDPGL